MHTIINKHVPKLGKHVINEDGMVWTAEMPSCPREELPNKKYRASIPDARLDHLGFECFGWHTAWADSIEELIEDIKSFDVPYYSKDVFLDKLHQTDATNKRDDRQIELYWDGRGTKITRGKMTYNNMTAYTSL